MIGNIIFIFVLQTGRYPDSLVYNKILTFAVDKRDVK